LYEISNTLINQYLILHLNKEANKKWHLFLKQMNLSLNEAIT
jgi:hypothetical protein